MGLVFRPQAKRAVPTGRLKIDWSHPLANGLIGCWVPALMPFIDLTGINADLSVFHGPAAMDVGPEGPYCPGYNYNGLGGSNLWVSPALPSNSPFLNWNKFSVYYRGERDGRTALLGNGQCYFFYVSYDGVNPNFPYQVFQIGDPNGNDLSNVKPSWNDGTNSNASTTGTSLASQSYGTVSMLATAQVGGNVITYQRGVQVDSTSFGSSSSPISTANAQINLGGWNFQTRETPTAAYVYYAWNRVLSASEAAWIDQDPYCFLIPVEGEMPVVSVLSPISSGLRTPYAGSLTRVRQGGLLLPNRKPSSGPSGVTLPRGITAYWPLDAANCEFSVSGGQVRPLDLVGNNYGADAKSTGVAGRPPFDQDGIGFNFDATTNTYCVLNSDPLQGTTGTGINATFAIWAYYRGFAGSNGPGRLFNCTNQVTITNEDGGQGSGQPVGSVIVEISGGVNGRLTTVSIPLNTWTHIAFTVVAGLPTEIFINGAAAPSLPNALGFSTSASNCIGSRDSTNRILDGKLAHAMVCNGTVLTADEIADLYNSAFMTDEVMPAMFVTAAGGFIPAWARNSNLPIIGTGTY